MSETRKLTKEELINECGEVVRHFTDPASGLFGYHTLYCGFWRECPKCFNQRAREHEEELLSVMSKRGELKYASLPYEEEGAFKAATETENYMRYPRKDFVSFVFTETDYAFPQHIFVHDLNRETLRDIVGTLVNTQERKRISGKLYVMNSKEDREKGVSVLVTNFETRKEDRPKVQECMAKVIARSADWDPDEETIQFAINGRAELYREELKKVNVVILSEMNMRRRIDPDDIDWTAWQENFASMNGTNHELLLLIRKYRHKVLQEQMPTTGIDIETMKFLKGIPKPT